MHVVKGRQHTAHIRCPNRSDGVRLSTSKVTNLDASITEMNLTAQYSFQSSNWSGCGQHSIYIVQTSDRFSSLGKAPLRL